MTTTDSLATPWNGVALRTRRVHTIDFRSLASPTRRSIPLPMRLATPWHGTALSAPVSPPVDFSSLVPVRVPAPRRS